LVTRCVELEVICVDSDGWRAKYIADEEAQEAIEVNSDGRGEKPITDEEAQEALRPWPDSSEGCRIISRTKPPAALHASTESRKVALGHYQLSFSSVEPFCGCCVICKMPAIVYLNFEIDFIVLKNGFDAFILEYLWKYPVSRLAIDLNDQDCNAYHLFNYWSDPRDWKQLKQVMLFNRKGQQRDFQMTLIKL
jgi:hypothetical protein